jgi:hypothetical protein
MRFIIGIKVTRSTKWTANDFHQDNSVVNRIPASQRFLPAASYNFQVPKSVLFVQIGKTQTIDK